MDDEGRDSPETENESHPEPASQYREREQICMTSEKNLRWSKTENVSVPKKHCFSVF